MNSKHLAHIAAIYGEGWEQIADAIHPLIAAAEAGDVFTDSWADERIDPRSESVRAHDEFSAEVEDTRRAERKEVSPTGEGWFDWDTIDEIPL
jgi:hypothetical protein